MCQGNILSSIKIANFNEGIMDYNLSEEMKMLRDTTYDFAKSEITPLSFKCDREERYTPEICKQAAELGLVGDWIPEEYGGTGVGILDQSILAEQLFRVDMGICCNILFAEFGCQSIYLYGRLCKCCTI